MNTLQKLCKGSYRVEGAMCDVQCALAAGKNVQSAGVKQVKNNIIITMEDICRQIFLCFIITVSKPMCGW